MNYINALVSQLQISGMPEHFYFKEDSIFVKDLYGDDPDFSDIHLYRKDLRFCR